LVSVMSSLGGVAFLFFFLVGVASLRGVVFFLVSVMSSLGGVAFLFFFLLVGVFLF